MSEKVKVSLGEAVRQIMAGSKDPMTPQQIKEHIKDRFQHLYGTEAHRVNIEKGNFNDFEHALLNGIYGVVKGADFAIDRSHKPFKVSLLSGDIADEVLPRDLEKEFEAETGIVYVFNAGIFTEDGKRIIKIGHTTQSLDARIAQLYTTGTPSQFTVLHSWRTSNYVELEQALHRLLAPFRINRAREFFTDDALRFVEQIVVIHKSVQDGL